MKSKSMSENIMAYTHLVQTILKESLYSRIEVNLSE